MKAIHSTWGEVEVLAETAGDDKSLCRLENGVETFLSKSMLKIKQDERPAKPDTGTKTSD